MLKNLGLFKNAILKYKECLRIEINPDEFIKVLTNGSD